MLKLTLLNSNNDTSFKTQFASIFSQINPYKYKKDVWDFGDRLCIGNRNLNKIEMWESIERNAVEIDRNGVKQEIYIDIFSSTDEIGYGPCECKTTESIVRYDAEYIALEIDGTTESLFISIKNPESINEIYGNLEHLLQDHSFSISKYDWIGEESNTRRPLYISRQTNNRKKKELLAKTPRIALTAVADNNRKRG